MDKEKTVVIYRTWKNENKSVIALFPEIPTDSNGTYCSSYEHIGQHGAAEYYGVIEQTIPSKPKEYKALHNELKTIGYNLIVKKRMSPKMDKNRRTKADRALWVKGV
jgi:hypothetical protein